MAVALIVESDKKFGLTDHILNETIILKFMPYGGVPSWAECLRERSAMLMKCIYLIGHVGVPRTVKIDQLN